MTRKADLVLEGGGIKAIALAGAINYAETQGYSWNNIAGTSAGALVGSLIVAGYSGKDLKELILNMNFTALCDRRLIQRLPVVGPAAGIALYMGLYSGQALEAWIRDILLSKGLRTFGDLKVHDEHNPRYRYRLQVIASDLTRGRMLILPDDVKTYGLDPDYLEVAKAIRMSTSIPFFYEPVIVRSSKSKTRKHFIVDGGVLSNYPVWIFDCPPNRVPRWPTIGLRLVDPRAGKPNQITGPLSLLTALFSTMLEAHDARHIEEANFVRTIAIDTLGVRTVDFNLPKATRLRLYDSGVSAARDFLKTWNFETYKERYRLPKELPAICQAKRSSTTRAANLLPK
ncbi:MAG: patatin-like phospholipase family protein [Firmicutes bacterium]|jgi:NTE family protein|nr:patatin-like phospholipase family protein [Bacillota bacterium]